MCGFIFISPGQWLLGVSLFRHLPLRAALAAAGGFLLSLLIGGWLIRYLRRRQIFENISEPSSAKIEELRQGKEKTPTMGGIMILGATLLSALLWCDMKNFPVLLTLLTMCAMGVVGFVDDYIKLTRPGVRGLSRKAKLRLQLVIGTAVGIVLWGHVRGFPHGTQLVVPFAPELGLEIGLLYIAFAAVVIAAASNATNLTDGLDGLASGCAVVTGLALAVASYVVGRPAASAFLKIVHVPGTAELAVLCSALVGAVLGFLWYNCHPAQIFMGDTGSLSIGAAIGVVALLLKLELLLLAVASVFMMELISVAMQIGWFKLTHKRIFLCAPIHHHFQFLGWPETKVTVRFWILATILALTSIAALRLP